MFYSSRDVLERTENTRAGRIGLGPMTSKVIGPVSSTEKSCYYNALIDFKGITARGGPERVRGGEGHVGGVEVGKGGFRGGLAPHEFFPVLKDMLLYKGIVTALAWWTCEQR